MSPDGVPQPPDDAATETHPDDVRMAEREDVPAGVSSPGPEATATDDEVTVAQGVDQVPALVPSAVSETLPATQLPAEVEPSVDPVLPAEPEPLVEPIAPAKFPSVPPPAEPVVPSPSPTPRTAEWPGGAMSAADVAASSAGAPPADVRPAPTPGARTAPPPHRGSQTSTGQTSTGQRPVGRAERRAGIDPQPHRRGRRRLWRVLLAAVLAVVVVAGAVLLTINLTGNETAGTQAEQLPDAVLPQLSEPTPVLAALSADALAPAPGVLAGVLAPLLAAPSLGTGLSAQVVDVATGHVLFDQAAEDPSTPASTAKLLTAFAALTSLDPTSTLTTTVVSGATPGEIVLVGGGDPTLSTTNPSQSYPGAATVADLAAQVQRQLGATPVTRVVVDGSLFSGPLTAPGWQPDDAPSSYAAPVTALAVDGARVNAGSAMRSGSPGTDAGTALAEALGVPGAAVALGTAPVGARTLGTVHSASIERLIEQALTASDNLLAESLARQVALKSRQPASFAGAAKAVAAAVKAAGLDTAGLSMVDGSGLSQQDRVPASLLVDVVRAASDGAVPAAAGLLSGLPIAGYNGTLAERAADGNGVPGAVRAKTGTLLSVNDLAGTVLTADGRLLAFAVLADGATGSLVATETALDVVAAALAGCGCR